MTVILRLSVMLFMKAMVLMALVLLRWIASIGYLNDTGQ